MAFSRPDSLRRELARALPDRPFTVAFWDGAELPATSGDGSSPTFTVRSPRAAAHLLRAPGQLGLGRAYVTGDIDVDNLDEVASLLRSWSPPPVDGAAKRRLALAAVKAAGVQRVPSIPESELVPEGRRHALRRDARSVRHHYDLPPEFFALFLDRTQTYSCAIFETPEQSLDDAQVNKREVICRKLALRPGMRMLDVGCGWGALSVHAAEHHGVDVVGITLSEPQAARARRRAIDHGVADKCEFRVMDYRDLPAAETFDAIASIGMVEHVGSENIDVYARQLADRLAPGGRLLNHGIARLRHGDPEAGPFSERYVFPDAAPLHLSRITLAIERAGLSPEHVEGYAEHYALTLFHWLANLERNIDAARALVGDERVRIWQLYLRVARSGFETGFLSIFQVRASKPA